MRVEKRGSGDLRRFAECPDFFASYQPSALLSWLIAEGSVCGKVQPFRKPQYRGGMPQQQ
jgi:hypothetical protein